MVIINKVFKIAIVGSGELGSRHLQGLKMSNAMFDVFVVDPLDNALQLSKNRLEEVSSKININKIFYFNSLALLPKKIDLVIIATTSSVRKKIISDLLQNIEVKYLILEKIVFQKPSDFYEIKEIFDRKNIRDWVNLPRRYYNVYRSLKLKINGNINLFVKGNNWGLGCNSIHFIDLFIFLNNQFEINFNTEFLYNKIYESKRKGYKEFFGELIIKNIKGNQAILSDIKDYDSNENCPLIIIKDNDYEYIIDEQKNTLIQKNKNNVFTEDIKIPYQSDLTGIIVDDILKSSKSKLPTFDECLKYHVPLIDSFIKHMSLIENKEITSCPIT